MPRLVDRRYFVRAAGAAFLAALPSRSLAATLAADAVYATAFMRRDGRYGAAILSEAGEMLHAVDLPERGHDVCFDRISGRAAVFARQPGTFAMVFDPAGRTAPQTLESAPGRHFFGHGAFSPDGKLLFATENDFDTGAGMVGVYGAGAGFARIGEFPTYGIGPHELILLADGVTLAVCNGGIETHPDFGRAELNLSTMEPSFVLVDSRTGDLVEKHVLPPALHQLSIRHMDVDASGAVWFGCQHRGPASERPPLVGRAVRGEELALVELPEPVLAGFRNYVGSVAVNATAGTVAVSSPQGNVMAVLDAADGKLVTLQLLGEVCGVAPDGEGYLASTGTGDLVRPQGAIVHEPDVAWDNHLLRIG